ncbi:Serralysin B precursor [Methylobrevis pamukkalensis]|uniref:Serralysin B n=2 Tax=Methylobrevis pamukkalensis TaxID=1439726 RepID=A0A1E3GZ21_9HYPH|nr:Serralysin B precursor [Methylobrevis pamukkalensis]
MQPGKFSSIGGLRGNVGIALGTYIENAIGTNYDDLIIGNEKANRLEGGKGIDTLVGLKGADTLIGGDGDDILLGGVDADRLEGGAGNDRLEGGTGGDAMVGGLGRDVYLVDGALDVVVERSAEGVDEIRLQTSAQISISHVEKVTLEASAQNVSVKVGIRGEADPSTKAHLVVTGNDKANSIQVLYNDSRDPIIGLLGGAGADTFHFGGTGDFDFFELHFADFQTKSDKLDVSNLIDRYSYQGWFDGSFEGVQMYRSNIKIATGFDEEGNVISETLASHFESDAQWMVFKGDGTRTYWVGDIYGSIAHGDLIV